MPKSRMDTPKRKCAQALNHLAGAVLDMNDVYELFDQSITRMIDSAVSQGVQPNEEAVERYRGYKESFRKVMMYVIVPREELLKLIAEMWELDEESIKIYLG